MDKNIIIELLKDKEKSEVDIYMQGSDNDKFLRKIRNVISSIPLFCEDELAEHQRAIQEISELLEIKGA